MLVVLAAVVLHLVYCCIGKLGHRHSSSSLSPLNVVHFEELAVAQNAHDPLILYITTTATPSLTSTGIITLAYILSPAAKYEQLNVLAADYHVSC